MRASTECDEGEEGASVYKDGDSELGLVLSSFCVKQLVGIANILFI